VQATDLVSPSMIASSSHFLLLRPPVTSFDEFVFVLIAVY